MKNKLIKKYYPECHKEDIKYFKTSWIDKSLNELIKIYKTKNNRLTKNNKLVLADYIAINYEEIEKFGQQCLTVPIFDFVFRKYSTKSSLNLNHLYNLILYFNSLESHCHLFINTILTLRKAEQRKKFSILQDYLERKINDKVL